MIQTVEVIISGGAVQHVEFPRGIRVVIRDYDVESTDADSGFDTRKDEKGDLFQHMEFIHEEDKKAACATEGNLKNP